MTLPIRSCNALVLTRIISQSALSLIIAYHLGYQHIHFLPPLFLSLFQTKLPHPLPAALIHKSRNWTTRPVLVVEWINIFSNDTPRSCIFISVFAFLYQSSLGWLFDLSPQTKTTGINVTSKVNGIATDLSIHIVWRAWETVSSTFGIPENFISPC